jgi:hypothetical protein
MKENRLRVVENTVLRKIFGPKMDMWRGLVNAEINLQVP